MKMKLFEQTAGARAARSAVQWTFLGSVIMLVALLTGCATQPAAPSPQTLPAAPAGAFPLKLSGLGPPTTMTAPSASEMVKPSSGTQLPAVTSQPVEPSNPAPVSSSTASAFKLPALNPSLVQFSGSQGRPQSPIAMTSQVPTASSSQLAPAAGSQTLTIQPAAYRPSQYHLNVGDQLDISVFRIDASKDDDMRRTVLIGPDGYISYFFVNGLQAAGLTVPELQTQLSERLSQYIRSPGVVVILAQPPQKRVYVVGQVVEQGVRQLDTNHGDTLADAIFASKGLTQQANVDQAYVIRKDAIISVNLGHLLFAGDQTQNVVLQTGDVVYVPEVVQQEVFVMGYVTRATAVPVSRPISVTEAIAQAQGFRLGAQKSDVQVIHGGLGTGTSHPVVETVDMNQVLAGNGGEVYVQRGDIVYVPSTVLGSWNEFVSQLTPSLLAMFESFFIAAQMP